MPERSTSRSDMVRGVSQRLSVVEGDAKTPRERATQARDLSRRLAETLDRVERTISQRRLLEKDLDETRATGNRTVSELSAALAFARRTEHEAGQALSQALQNACDALAKWSQR